MNGQKTPNQLKLSPEQFRTEGTKHLHKIDSVSKVSGVDLWITQLTYLFTES